MAKLYKSVEVFAGRFYDHGGGGLEIGGLVFYRSIQEYAIEATQKGWDKIEKSYGKSWVSEPEDIQVLMEPKKYKLWLVGKIKITEKDVFICSGQAGFVAKIGGWQ